MEYREVTSEDVNDVEIDYDDREISEWDDDEVLKLFFECWTAINQTECFGTRDLLHEQRSARVLDDRGYIVDMVEGTVHEPKEPQEA